MVDDGRGDLLYGGERVMKAKIIFETYSGIALLNEKIITAFPLREFWRIDARDPNRILVVTTARVLELSYEMV